MSAPHRPHTVAKRKPGWAINPTKFRDSSARLPLRYGLIFRATVRNCYSRRPWRAMPVLEGGSQLFCTKSIRKRSIRQNRDLPADQGATSSPILKEETALARGVISRQGRLEGSSGIRSDGREVRLYQIISRHGPMVSFDRFRNEFREGRTKLMSGTRQSYGSYPVSPPFPGPSR